MRPNGGAPGVRSAFVHGVSMFQKDEDQWIGDFCMAMELSSSAVIEWIESDTLGRAGVFGLTVERRSILLTPTLVAKAGKGYDGIFSPRQIGDAG